MAVRISHRDTNPKVLNMLLNIEDYLHNSSLDPKLLELLKYRVSQINGCAYCLDMHYKIALALGEDQLRLHTLPAWRECSYYNEKEKAVLAYAEAMTNVNTGNIDDAVFNALESFFTHEQIGDLTLAVTQINTWNRINKAYRTEAGHFTMETAKDFIHR